MEDRIALEMIGALSAARKVTHLYPPAHPKYREAVVDLVGAVQECIVEGPFTLNVHLGRLYRDSRILPSDAPGAHAMAEALEAHRVESITFEADASEHDAVTLVEVLAMRPSAALEVAAELARRGASAITIAEFIDEDAADAEERDRLREQDRALYKRLLSVLRTLTAKIQETGEPNVGDAGAIVEGILARLMDDSAAVLGLATMNSQNESNLFHSINTMIYALILGNELGIPEEGLSSLGVAALLHDIGKVAFDMSDPIQAEQARYLHPKIGADILSRLPEQDRTPLLVAYEHHMAPNGAGFPDREDGYVTHPYSRMVAIADRYDRLTTTKPEGFSLTPDQAVIQLLRDTSSLLDQTLTRLFVKSLGVFPVGCIVRLSDHSVGVVCASGTDTLHPRVRLMYDAEGIAMDAERELETAEAEVGIVEIVSPDSLAVTVSDHL